MSEDDAKGQDVWRDLARMEAELQDPDEEETRAFDRDSVLERARQLAERRRQQSEKAAPQPPPEGAPQSAQQAAAESEPPPSVDAPSDDEPFDDEPTQLQQIDPRQALEAARASAGAKRGEGAERAQTPPPDPGTAGEEAHPEARRQGATTSPAQRPTGGERERAGSRPGGAPAVGRPLGRTHAGAPPRGGAAAPAAPKPPAAGAKPSARKPPGTAPPRGGALPGGKRKPPPPRKQPAPPKPSAPQAPEPSPPPPPAEATTPAAEAEPRAMASTPEATPNDTSESAAIQEGPPKLEGLFDDEDEAPAGDAAKPPAATPPEGEASEATPPEGDASEAEPASVPAPIDHLFGDGPPSSSKPSAEGEAPPPAKAPDPPAAQSSAPPAAKNTPSAAPAAKAQPLANPDAEADLAALAAEGEQDKNASRAIYVALAIGALVVIGVIALLASLP